VIGVQRVEAHDPRREIGEVPLHGLLEPVGVDRRNVVRREQRNVGEVDADRFGDAFEPTLVRDASAFTDV